MGLPCLDLHAPLWSPNQWVRWSADEAHLTKFFFSLSNTACHYWDSPVHWFATKPVYMTCKISRWIGPKVVTWLFHRAVRWQRGSNFFVHTAKHWCQVDFLKSLLHVDHVQYYAMVLYAASVILNSVQIFKLLNGCQTLNAVVCSMIVNTGSWKSSSQNVKRCPKTRLIVS